MSRPLRERITEMQVMIEGQSRFQPFGLPYWGSENLNKGVGSMTASYDYHISVDYHKSWCLIAIRNRRRS